MLNLAIRDLVALLALVVVAKLLWMVLCSVWCVAAFVAFAALVLVPAAIVVAIVWAV